MLRKMGRLDDSGVEQEEDVRGAVTTVVIGGGGRRKLAVALLRLRLEGRDGVPR